MTQKEVTAEIEDLEEGQDVSFVVESQDRYKLHFSYQVGTVAPDSTVDVHGPRNGQWRFVIENGRPQLKFKSPSSGWQSAGVLDYVEGRG